ncbi:MAG: molybdate ABC transporter substrate-binding protein [Campylobacteraceae bacterium]|jgi:molybdate transport system substrate-binding protein|nr:molybdate ABC transporter substrate-binding protein [Campylobacteraceae bacterium]
MRIFYGLIAVMLIAVSSIAGEIKVAVAANVQNAFDDLIKVFNKNYPDIKVLPTFGPSGAFATQIKNGAPFDLLLSADTKFPTELYDSGFAVSKPVVYAQGAIVLFSTKGLDLSKGLEILKDSKVIKISIANPNTAPYGRASVEALKNAKVYDAIEKKIVQAENIGQVVAQVVAAADIGFPAKSAFLGRKNEYKEGIHWVNVNPDLYTPIAQGIIIVKASEKNADAKKFYDFILGEKSKKIFTDFGYLVK